MKESDKKIDEYRELIKKHGSKNASKKMREKGGLYDDDFTKTHKNNPVFSDEVAEKLAGEIPVPIVQKALRIDTEISLPTSGGEWLTELEPEPTNNVQTPEEEEIYC